MKVAGSLAVVPGVGWIAAGVLTAASIGFAGAALYNHFKENSRSTTKTETKVYSNQGG